MMKVKHKKTGDERSVSREQWEVQPGKYGPSRNDWEIIDEGDPVIWIEYLKDGRYTELKILDRDHAKRIIKANPESYSYIELSKGTLKPVVPFSAIELIDYSQDQLAFLWALWRVNNADPVKGPNMYLVSNILMELHGTESLLTGKEWLQELIDDHLIVGHTGSPMISGIRTEGVTYISDSYAKFQNFEKQFGAFIKKFNEKNFFDRVRQIDVKAETYKLFKHALSNDIHDLGLVAGEYALVGLIGYSTKTEDKGSKELKIIWLRDSNDQLIVSDVYKEKLEGRKFEEIGSLGFTSRNVTSLKLQRYHKPGDIHESDHLTCTRPVPGIGDLGYVDETSEVYDEVYLYEEPGEDRIPIYLYSTNPDVKVFEPIIEPSKESQTDKNAFLWSDAASKADELGRDTLVKSVTDSINQLFEKYQDAYTVLLNGEWGAGKSSMLHFFEKHLHDTGWHVIRYNAWENQRFSDPWWILINKISKYASDNSLSGGFNSHRYWKYKLQYKHKVWALLLLLAFGVSAYFFTASLGESDSVESGYNLGFYTSIVGLVGTFIGAITGLVNNFFYKSVSHEELKNQFTEHPFEPIRNRFNQIAKENDLAIFIDDLDRCDVEATVSLLEGIQNLFKEVRVLYIIAADGQWVSNCFNRKYHSFGNLTNDGCTIGDKFLQKTFQLTLNVPKPDPEYLKLYWDNLIGQQELLEEGHEEQPKSPKKATNEERQKTYSEAINRKKDETQKELEEQRKDIEENLEKYLRKFLKLGVPDNPRQMKRFVNQYEITRQTMVVEGTNDKYAEDDLVVKFLIFGMRYPSVAEKLKKGEVNLDLVFNGDLDLNSKDREEIENLLDGIDEELIRGDFYSI